MNAKTFEFFEMADEICKNPKMHTLNGTFGEVIAFLVAYAHGAVIFRNRGHHSLDPFQRFLAKQGIYESVGGFVGWSSFYDAYQDDETAIKEFQRLLSEFRGKVFEVEDIGVDIWLEENDAIKVHSVLSQIEFSEDNDARKDAVLKLQESLEKEIELQPLRKQVRWIPDQKQ
jgi:hypothetical protein